MIIEMNMALIITSYLEPNELGMNYNRIKNTKNIKTSVRVAIYFL